LQKSKYLEIVLSQRFFDALDRNTTIAAIVYYYVLNSIALKKQWRLLELISKTVFDRFEVCAQVRKDKL
jgi:hypothetical protein